MGIRIDNSVNPIPAEMRDGCFKYYVGSEVYTIGLPMLQKYTFELQCNQFIPCNVMAYLKNKDYCLVLRYDGTGCLYKNTPSRMLRGSFMFNNSDIAKVSATKLGGVHVDNGCRNVIQLKFVDDIVVMSSDSAFTFIMSASSLNKENAEYNDILRKFGLACSISVLKDVPEVINKDNEVVCKLTGDLYKAKGNIWLGGVFFGNELC